MPDLDIMRDFYASLDVLELSPHMMVTPGRRVIERETRSFLSKRASEGSRVRGLRKAREEFHGEKS